MWMKLRERRIRLFNPPHYPKKYLQSTSITWLQTLTWWVYLRSSDTCPLKAAWSHKQQLTTVTLGKWERLGSSVAVTSPSMLGEGVGGGGIFSPTGFSPTVLKTRLLACLQTLKLIKHHLCCCDKSEYWHPGISCPHHIFRHWMKVAPGEHHLSPAQLAADAVVGAHVCTRVCVCVLERERERGLQPQIKVIIPKIWLVSSSAFP